MGGHSRKNRETDGLEPEDTGLLEALLADHDATLRLLELEGGVYWPRFNIFVVQNALFVSAIAILASAYATTSDWWLIAAVFGLAFFGAWSSYLWALISARADFYQHFWMLKANDIERLIRFGGKRAMRATAMNMEEVYDSGAVKDGVESDIEREWKIYGKKKPSVNEVEEVWKYRYELPDWRLKRQRRTGVMSWRPKGKIEDVRMGTPIKVIPWFWLCFYFGIMIGWIIWNSGLLWDVV